MRPFVLLSVAASIDGYIDDASHRRLVLSSRADLDRVDQVRAESDAILVGAETLRRDDPRLLVRASSRRAARIAAGMPEHPLRVVVTESGTLDFGLRFWNPEGEKIIYTTDAGAAKLGEAPPATVVAMGPRVDFPAVLEDLTGRGVERLMVEGGGKIHTAFLAQGLVDEIHLAIAPLLVGQADAPRFLYPAAFPGAPDRRLRLLEARTVDDVVLIRYAVTTRPDPAADRRWLGLAVSLAQLCPPSPTAFSVGAVIVDANGREISRGYSRENDLHGHAEEVALAKLPPRDPRLAGATLYSSLEPCCRRRSRPRSCTQLILDAGIRRVVIAWREPDTFVSDCQGVEQLTAAGVEVTEIPSLADAARRPNAHLEL